MKQQELIAIHKAKYNSCLQGRQLIPALNAWVARAEYTTAHPIAETLDTHLVLCLGCY